MSDALLTVQEAAEALGIHEKRLRRLLARAEYRDRTETGTRETRTGIRTVSLLSSLLIADIRARLDMSPSTGSGDNRDTDGDGDNADGDKDTSKDTDRTGTERVQTPQNTMVRVSVAGLTALYEQRMEAQRETYELRLVAKDDVIASKDETIAALKLALSERQTPPSSAPAGDSGEVLSTGEGIVPPAPVESRTFENRSALGAIRAWFRRAW